MNMVLSRTAIYHITHVNNLPSIIAAGGLRTCRDLRNDNVDYTDIAHESIQTWRSTKEVTCGPGGVIHDYVPFYFAPRSPMLYATHSGTVAHYQEGQGQILHLVSSVQAVKESDLSFVFTDGHSSNVISEFYDELSNLDRIDWEIMKKSSWHDRAEDNDRKRRRQAEFLVHKFCPWELIDSIGVQRMKSLNG